jgi:large subunit ribosomal protein L29
MKGRTSEDLRKLSVDDLGTAIRDSEETLTNLRFQKTMGELANTSYLLTLRKDIARMKTILHERTLSIR